MTTAAPGSHRRSASELPVEEVTDAWTSASSIALDPSDEQAASLGEAEVAAWVPQRYRRPASEGRIRRPEGWPDRATAARLSDEEIERLGRTFIALEARMDELKETFGLGDEDLNIDLGPLGKLM